MLSKLWRHPGVVTTSIGVERPISPSPLTACYRSFSESGYLPRPFIANFFIRMDYTELDHTSDYAGRLDQDGLGSCQSISAR